MQLRSDDLPRLAVEAAFTLVDRSLLFFRRSSPHFLFVSCPPTFLTGSWLVFQICYNLPPMVLIFVHTFFRAVFLTAVSFVTFFRGSECPTAVLLRPVF